MYAVIRTGGKQYKVAENDVLAIERVDGEREGEITFSNVLALHDGTDLKVGAPFVDGAVVTADIIDQSRGAKVIVFKKKRRQGYRRKKGHRQFETVIRITGILAEGRKRAADKREAPKEEAPKEHAPKEQAAEAAEAPAAKTAPETAPATTAAKKPAAVKKPAAKTAAKKPAATKAAAKKTPAKTPAKTAAKKPAARKPAEQKD
jgi:large subunit ribosomal protein L21